MTNLIVSTVRQLWFDNKGVTAMEYALIGVLIAVFIVAAVSTLGTNLAGIFLNIASSI